MWNIGSIITESIATVYCSNLKPGDSRLKRRAINVWGCCIFYIWLFTPQFVKKERVKNDPSFALVSCCFKNARHVEVVQEKI